MKPVRIALLGTGAMSEYQRTKFSGIAGVEVAACFDANPAKAERFAREHGLAQHFSSLETLLDQAAVDAVSCCLVDAGHFTASMASLERGVALFCEKPLANTLVKARTLAAKAESSGLPTMVNLSKRNAPALHALKADLDAGTLGVIESVDARYHQGWVVTKVWGDWEVEPRWKWRLQAEHCTAGVVGDLGVHLMDALLYLFGLPDQFQLRRARDLAAAGLFRDRLDSGFEASGSGVHPAYVDLEAELRFGGVPCRFSVSWVDEDALDSFRIRIQGTRATALLDLEASRTAYTLTGAGHREVPGPMVEATYHRFVNAVRSGRGGIPGPAEALAAQEALETLLGKGIV